MTVRDGTHVRSLRMPLELKRGVEEASKRLRVPENRFICQAVAFVLRESGIRLEEPAAADDVEDPFR